MFENTQQKIRQALRGVEGPGGRDIVDGGLVGHVTVEKGRARIIIEWPDTAPPPPAFEAAVKEAALGVNAVKSVSVILTRHGPAGPAAPAEGMSPEASAAPEGIRVQPAPQRPPGRGATRLELPGVNAIIAVASGKGGVGKSTVAVNLALALASRGHAVGLLDADIYGPSVPRMLGITDKPQTEGPGGKLLPVRAFGLSVMSIGLLVDTDTPMIWRGPMVMSALSQMLGDVAWGTLDMLIVDMPPGTGDAQLTMAQRVPLAGAVIVSTPQEIALIDARKGIAMFERTQVPILGIVENMAYLQMPGMDEKLFLFGEGGARRTAERSGAPFLGEVPIYPALREGSDAGRPLVAEAPEGPEAQAFLTIAEGLETTLDHARRPPPHIVFED
ncbi:MAG: P-loop NTPase [Alphaproteobacteria bacterium]